MRVINTTIQNRSKQARLSSEHKIPYQNVTKPETADFISSLINLKTPKDQIIFSLGKALLGKNENPAVEKFLSEFKCPIIEFHNIPSDEFDILGSAYQFLNSKMENLKKGSFYTGVKTALDIVGDLDFSKGQTIFDPSCGSGSFLFNSSAKPEQIFGVDFDPIAVMIAKFNYFLKFPHADYPNIFHADFFEWSMVNSGLKFDYVVGNPPYGANLNMANIQSGWVKSGESFSYFIETGFNLIKPDGIFRYLLPESILNVKRHTDIREFLLDQTDLRRIKKYSEKFSGVMSDVYLIEARRGSSTKVNFETDALVRIPVDIFRGLKNSIFVQLDEKDIQIIRKIEEKSPHSLAHSIFGLGVVTGDNKTRLLSKSISKAEPIFSGKEVEPYRLTPAKNYIVFDREKMQQVAPEEIYRAPLKLVYKTISKRLKVAIDTTGSLTTNSANIIIPIMPGYSPYSVAGFLNSDLYSYLHYKLFGGVNKIAKENLMALPFPKLTALESRKLEKLSLKAIVSGSDIELQKYINRIIFGLTEDEIAYIKTVI